MARREVVVNECDVCGRDEDQVDGIETHTIVIDGYGVEGEICSRDWERVLKGVAKLSQKGRPIDRKVKTSVAKAVPWPGSAWKFTPHALTRIGERKLNPMKVVSAAEDPETTLPGRLPESTVHIRGTVKVVVNEGRHVIITAAHRDDPDLD